MICFEDWTSVLTALDKQQPAPPNLISCQDVFWMSINCPRQKPRFPSILVRGSLVASHFETEDLQAKLLKALGPV
jgi:hypothetical protein